uniref:DUF4283 domain-containing protein n=1 Tax=Glycine max TaxID=3847 RepID=A0A0R0G396_SOYBN
MKTEEGDTSSKEMSYLSSLLSTNFFVGSDVPYLSMEEDQRDGDKMSKDKSEEEKDFISCPIVNILDSECVVWCAPWKGSLVVHVLRKTVGFKMLEYKLQQGWAQYGKIRIVDMPDYYYLVQFTSEKDYRHALFEGSWMVADHDRWRPAFLESIKTTKKIIVWRVKTMINTTLKIDKLTSIYSRGKFARICIEVDL